MEEENNDNAIPEEEEDIESKKKERKHDSGAADLEKVTNYAEEKEIKSDADILSYINDVKQQQLQEKLIKDKELAKVAIKKTDVELIMRELEVTKLVAERTLREHKGDLQQTLVVLTN